jgi:hypothetical protein
MITSAIEEMNRVFALFIERHPRFLEEGGKIHILGHSLGSLLAADILSHHNYTRHLLKRDRSLAGTPVGGHIDLSELASPVVDTPSSTYRRKKTSGPTHIDTTTKISSCIHFPVDKYFAMGSPLGLFGVLKGASFGVPMSVMKEYFRDWITEFQARAPKSVPPHFREVEEAECLRQVLDNEMDLHLDVGAFYHIVSRVIGIACIIFAVPSERSRRLPHRASHFKVAGC